MADKKKLLSEESKNEELTDEQVNEVTGGAGRPRARNVVPRASCDVCKEIVDENRLTYTYFKGVFCTVCDKCLKSK